MFTCPNLNDPEIAKIVKVVGEVRYYQLSVLYGDNIPESALKKTIANSPDALDAIRWLENAHNWKQAVFGIPEPFRSEVQATIDGAQTLEQALGAIARGTGINSPSGRVYDEPMKPYINNEKIPAITPTWVGMKYFGMDGGGFISSASSEGYIQSIYKKHGFDVEVKKAKSGKYYVVHNGKMVRGMYNLSDPLVFDEQIGVKVREFLSAVGVPVEYVDQIVTEDGLSANAAVTMAEIDGSIRAAITAVYGVSDAVMSEEAAHILVAMLRDTPMYGQMMADITSRPEYAEVLEEYGNISEYKGDMTKLKEEAVAKVIVKYMADTPVLPTDAGWFERIIRYIKNKIAEVAGKIPNNPYAGAANMILNPAKIVNQPMQQGKATVMYNLKAAEGWKKANDEGRIGRVEVADGNELYTLDGNEMGVRATTVARGASSLRNKDFVPTESQAASFELSRENGNLLHAMAEKAVSDILNNTIPASGEIRSLRFYNAIRPELERIITEAKQKDPNAQVFTEISVVDPGFTYKDPLTKKTVKGIGGTIDLLIVYSDGTADIYDYKTFGRKGISAYKLSEYGTQLKLYKKVLEKGLPELEIPPLKISKSRIIPVKIDVRKGAVSDVETQSQIPVAYELTTDPTIDAVLVTLYDRLDALGEKSRRGMSDAEKELLNSEITTLHKAIQQTLLSSSFEYIAKEAKDLLNKYLTALPVADFSYLRTIMDAAQGYEAYQTLIGQSEGDVATLLQEVVGLATKVYQKAREQALDRFKNDSEFGDGFDLTGEYFETTVREKLFRHFRQSFKNPVGRAFTLLMSRQQEKARQSIKELNKEIVSAAKGLDRSAFSLMVNKAKGTLVARFSSEFYKEKERAKADSDSDWAVRNLKVNIELFDAAKEREFKKLQERKDLKPETQAKFYEEWVNVQSNPLTSRFSEPLNPEQWYSPEFKALTANPAALEFYEFFQAKIRELDAMMGIYNSPTFMPKVSAGTLEKLATDPEHVRKTLWRNFSDPKYGEDENTGNYHPVTGKPIYEIPIYFRDTNIKPEEQSYDLDRLLFKYGEMAIKHSLMQEIEDRTLLLQHVLETASFIQVNNQGIPIINRITKKVQQSVKASATESEHFSNMVNFYLYGIRQKEMNQTIHYVNKAVAFNAIRVLGANPISGLVNYTAGKANQFIQAARGTYFSTGQLLEGTRMIVSKNKKAYELMSAMNFFQDIPSIRYAMMNKNLDRFVDDSLLFAMLEYPELNVQFSTAMAVMQNYTVFDGKVMRRFDAAKKMLGYYNLHNYTDLSQRREIVEKIKKQEAALPSLFDQASAVDGKLHINGVYDVNLNASISGLIQEVNKKIFGNMSPDDIAGYKLQVLGRVIMQFRSWMPRTVDERFQELKYNDFLMDWEMGRYRSTIEHFRSLLSEQAEGVRLSVLLSPEKAAKISYHGYVARYREKFKTEPKITEEEYVNLHVANLKANIAGILISMGALVGALAIGAAMDDDDEKKKSFIYRNSLIVAKRVYGELSFYIDPFTLPEMLKNPAALLGLYTDVALLVKHLGQEGIGQMVGNEDWIEAGKPLKKMLQLTPVARPAYNLLQDWAEQNNIELGIK